MKKLGIFMLMTAVMMFSLTVALPVSAEARGRGGQHGRGQGWHHGNGGGWRQQEFYQPGGHWGGHWGGHGGGYWARGDGPWVQGHGPRHDGWPEFRNRPNQRPRHDPAPSWCPYW